MRTGGDRRGLVSTCGDTWGLVETGRDTWELCETNLVTCSRSVRIASLAATVHRRSSIRSSTVHTNVLVHVRHRHFPFASVGIGMLVIFCPPVLPDLNVSSPCCSLLPPSSLFASLSSPLSFSAGRREQLHAAAAASVPVPGGLPPQHVRQGRAQQPAPRVRLRAGRHKAGQPRRDAPQ